MRSIGKRVWTAGAGVLFLLVAMMGLSQADSSPQSIVEKYCSLDAQGANCSASNSNAKALWALLINEDEAGYDQSVVTRAYHFGKLKVTGTSADVEVTYDDLGTLAGNAAKKNPHSETVVFHLTKEGNYERRSKNGPQSAA